ncbi:DUF11 domain-containing protein [Paenibacillus taiwanensis]|uniref:DUF11 domain-containing protein n=1 Tax=Paenibacillus taiwanensis TaxID=401638 RepID=UPI000417A311|nr:DUF11 domain-containing protein [Paenibacillus taiwanensis]
MLFKKTDRLALKVIGNLFGKASEISLDRSSYIRHAQLMLVADVHSHFNDDIELKVYGKSHVIPYKNLEQTKFSPIDLFTIDITSLVTYAGSTTFVVDKLAQKVEPVTGQQDPAWGLVIIYGDPFLPVRHVSLSVGESASVTNPLIFSQLLTSSIGPNNGTLFLFGKIRAEFSSSPLLFFGPNMEQLSSIYPLVRVTDPITPFSKSMLNQEIDISATLLPAQTAAIFHTPIESNDLIRFLAIGLQIDAVEPKMSLVHSADKEHVQVGESVTYTTIIRNTGTTVAECVQFRTGFPDGTSFISDSLTINNIPIAIDPSDKLLLRNMPVGDTLTVKYKVKIVHKPSSAAILHQTVLDYNFTPLENTIAVGNQPSNISTVHVHP